MVLFSLLLYLAQRIQIGEMAHDQWAFGIWPSGENINGCSMRRNTDRAANKDKKVMISGRWAISGVIAEGFDLLLGRDKIKQHTWT